MTAPLDIETAAREAIEEKRGRAVSITWSGTLVVEDGEVIKAHEADWIQRSRTREPLLAEEVLRLRAWMRHIKLQIRQEAESMTWTPEAEVDAAISGAPAPEVEP